MTTHWNMQSQVQKAVALATNRFLEEKFIPTKRTTAAGFKLQQPPELLTHGSTTKKSTQTKNLRETKSAKQFKPTREKKWRCCYCGWLHHLNGLSCSCTCGDGNRDTPTTKTVLSMQNLMQPMQNRLIVDVVAEETHTDSTPTIQKLYGA